MAISLGVIVWHLDTGEPTWAAWTMAGGYAVAAVLCALAGFLARPAGPQHADRRQPWRVITGGLLFLGLNKLVALQTWMIKLGRVSAQPQGWYEHRRTVQAVFVGIFVILVLTAGIAFWRRWKSFAKEQTLGATGVLVLLLFMIVRAVSICHVDKLFHADFHDDYWSWLLELGGAACLGCAAAQARTR